MGRTRKMRQKPTDGRKRGQDDSTRRPPRHGSGTPPAAVILRRSRAYDSADYLCGYAVEIALKVCICRTLRWQGFPESKKEFEGKLSLKVHDLNALLEFTGIQSRFQNPPLR